jgi:hypothetical protein
VLLKHVLCTCLQLLEVNELVLEPLTDDKVSVLSSTGKKGTSNTHKVRKDDDTAPTSEAQEKTEEKWEEGTAPNPEAQKKRHKTK